MSLNSANKTMPNIWREKYSMERMIVNELFILTYPFTWLTLMPLIINYNNDDIQYSY